MWVLWVHMLVLIRSKTTIVHNLYHIFIPSFCFKTCIKHRKKYRLQYFHGCVGLKTGYFTQISEGKGANGMEAQHSSRRAKEDRVVLCNVNPKGCSEHTSSERLTGISRLEAKGKFLASNGEIVYLFLWIPLISTRGISSSSPAIVLRIFADHPTAFKTFKDRKEKNSCCWPTGYIYSRRLNMLFGNSVS